MDTRGFVLIYSPFTIHYSPFTILHLLLTIHRLYDLPGNRSKMATADIR